MSDKQTKKELSSRKLQANRQNAQRSTGPKSVEGKQRSSANSYKHGVFADRLFGNPKQPAVDREEYERLYAGFKEHYSPVGFMENLLVERIAAESLRQTRLLGYEQVVLAYSAAFETKSIGNLIRYDSTLGRKQEKAIEQLEKLQAQRLARSNELEVDCEPEIEFPDFPENDERSEDHLTGEQTNKLNPEACQPTTASIASEANDCEKAIAMKDEPITSPPDVPDGDGQNGSVRTPGKHSMDSGQASEGNYETNPNCQISLAAVEEAGEDFSAGIG